MVCPHCQSPELRNLNRRTELGYAVFRCGTCRRKCNERTGSPFNYLELPTDVVFEIVLCRIRYKLSLRNLAEMFLRRTRPPRTTLRVGNGCADSNLRMRRSENGKSVLLCCWLSIFGANGKGRWADAGTSMKPTSRLRESGAICIAPLTETAISWTRC